MKATAEGDSEASDVVCAMLGTSCSMNNIMISDLSTPRRLSHTKLAVTGFSRVVALVDAGGDVEHEALACAPL